MVTTATVMAAMDMDIYEEAAPEMEETVVESTEDGSSTSSTEDYLASQKLIYTCDVDLQTLEFQNTMDALDALIEKYDGFVESESVSDNDHGWYYSDWTIYEVRPPMVTSKAATPLPSSAAWKLNVEYVLHPSGVLVAEITGPVLSIKDSVTSALPTLPA